MDALADRFEAQRRLEIGVLIRSTGNEDASNFGSSLTGKFVRAFRKKERNGHLCWYRRSRLVAREFNYLSIREDISLVSGLVPPAYLSSALGCPPPWACLPLLSGLSLVSNLVWDAVSASRGWPFSSLRSCLPDAASVSLVWSSCLSVSHVGWDAVSGSCSCVSLVPSPAACLQSRLGLSFSCLWPCLPACLWSGLWCCVRVLALVFLPRQFAVGVLHAFLVCLPCPSFSCPVLSPSLSPIWFGSLCPPSWACLLVSVSQPSFSPILCSSSWSGMPCPCFGLVSKISCGTCPMVWAYGGVIFQHLFWSASYRRLRVPLIPPLRCPPCLRLAVLTNFSIW